MWYIQKLYSDIDTNMNTDFSLWKVTLVAAHTLQTSSDKTTDPHHAHPHPQPLNQRTEESTPTRSISRSQNPLSKVLLGPQWFNRLYGNLFSSTITHSNVHHIPRRAFTRQTKASKLLFEIWVSICVNALTTSGKLLMTKHLTKFLNELLELVNSRLTCVPWTFVKHVYFTINAREKNIIQKKLLSTRD